MHCKIANIAHIDMEEEDEKEKEDEVKNDLVQSFNVCTEQNRSIIIQTSFCSQKQGK